MSPEPLRDSLTRKVQFALELLDPFTGHIVYKGISVAAKGSDGLPIGTKPLVSRSGRFVWLDNDSPPPATIAYDPGRLPYSKGEVNLSSGLPAGRLIGVKLRPGRAYELPIGVTAIRGRLVQTTSSTSRPISGAIVQIAWALKQPGKWIPPVPPDRAHLRFGEDVTDKDGEFVVFAHLPKPGTKFSEYVGYPPSGDQAFIATPIDLDFVEGLPKARLQITRTDAAASRTTPADLNFIDNLAPGRILVGRMLPRGLQLDWDKLQN